MVYAKPDTTRFRQGSILRDITLVEWADLKGEEVEIKNRKLPYSVILTQECDLDWDFKNRLNPSKGHDKYLQAILLCPAYPSENFRSGRHLEPLGLVMQSFSSDPWRELKKNNLYRYHFLDEDQDFQVPSLVLDFKHYFTIPRDILYGYLKDCYIATIGDLFREDLSNRFAQFLSRVGLPEALPVV